MKSSESVESLKNDLKSVVDAVCKTLKIDLSTSTKDLTSRGQVAFDEEIHDYDEGSKIQTVNETSVKEPSLWR